MVDAETAELQPSLSDGQREHDLEIMIENVTGGLLDVAARREESTDLYPQIFAEAHVEITDDLAATLTERTEGWPAGLYLAAAIASDSRGDALTITGDDRYVADYLYRESLMQLPESVQRFLRRTAVLDQLCASLCDALLEEPGAEGQLRNLEAMSLFLVPLDRQRRWFRYHVAFREYLLGELRRREPRALPGLRRRAAAWSQSAFCS